MSGRAIAGLVEGLLQVGIGAWLALLGFRVVGKKPGASLPYDEWHAKFAGFFKVGGPALALFGLFRLLPAVSTLGDSTVWTVADSPYYPLKLGTRWVYADAQDPKRRVDVIVVAHERLKERMWARVETRVNGQLDLREHLYALDFGVLKSAIGDTRLDPPLRVLSHPGQQKDWRHALPNGLYGFAQTEGVEVVVPFGRLTGCLEVSGELEVGKGLKSSKTWFAPGIGPVRLTQVFEDGRTLSLSLVDFMMGTAEVGRGAHTQ